MVIAGRNMPLSRLAATRIGKNRNLVYGATMLVIRRMVDRHGSLTAIFLSGEPPKIFPASDHEHGRILQIYKLDRRHQDLQNDFSEYDLRSSRIFSPSRSRHGGTLVI
jgi:hypothetical protein